MKPDSPTKQTELTDSRRAAENNRFLVALDDATRPLADAEEITFTSAKLLGEHLAADRCAYGDVEDDGDSFHVVGDYNRPPVQSMVGHYTLGGFGAEVLRLMRADVPYVVEDIETHDPPPHSLEGYRAAQVRAVVTVPLHKAGRLAAVMAVHQRVPRRWTPAEVELLRLVAGRCWESIERVRVSRELRQSEERFRVLANSMPQNVWTASADGTLEYYNRRWYEYSGSDPSLSGDASWAQVAHPDDLGPIGERWYAAVRAGTAFEMEFRLRRHDGVYRWFLARAEPVRDPDGRIVKWYGTSTDIDDQKRIEQALRESEARYRGLFESIDQGFCVIEVMYDDDGRARDYRFVEINPVFERQTGLTGAVGRNMRSMVPDIEQCWIDTYDRVVRTGESVKLENEAAAMGRWFEVFAFRTGGKGGRRVAVLFKDITDAKRAEREREELLAAERAARTEAERASHMKDEFLATLSHELRTPLNAILGWSQILRTSGGDADDVAEATDVIERNARAQTQIIEDLLDMSRIISGKIRLDVQEVDLEAVVRAAVETVRPAAEAKNIRILPVLDPLAHPVSGDPNRLQQVFWNLLSNAVKFSPKGGRVQVLLRRINSHLEVDVIDTGEGIEPQFLPFVFDRFRQADATTTRSHGGLGLGLAIVKQLVELHGGGVRAKSGGKGTGTTFSVLLPVTVLHPEPDPEPVRRHPRGDGATVDSAACAKLRGVRVLVVDDEPDARALVRRLLIDCHAEVAVAGGAGEAMDTLGEFRPDVLVSDIGMPGEDGYSLIRRVRERSDADGGDVPAIALTAYARAEDRVKVMTAGYHMHLSKPVEPAELITVVASLATRFARRPTANPL